MAARQTALSAGDAVSPSDTLTLLQLAELRVVAKVAKEAKVEKVPKALVECV